MKLTERKTDICGRYKNYDFILNQLMMDQSREVMKSNLECKRVTFAATACVHSGKHFRFNKNHTDTTFVPIPILKETKQVKPDYQKLTSNVMSTIGIIIICLIISNLDKMLTSAKIQTQKLMEQETISSSRNIINLERLISIFVSRD